jgi:hypothetical protein
MAGILRNIVTILAALFKYGIAKPADIIQARFIVTPLDTGVSKLKSDKYLHLAESAQIDFLMKTKLLGLFVRHGYSFVNTSQLVKFSKPIKVFSRVDVASWIIFWDEKCAYFEHEFLIHGKRHAQVLVKTKFEHGSRTIAPITLIGTCIGGKPDYLSEWDNAVDAM